jgi:hypothetical protein
MLFGLFTFRSRRLAGITGTAEHGFRNVGYWFRSSVLSFVHAAIIARLASGVLYLGSLNRAPRRFVASLGRRCGKPCPAFPDPQWKVRNRFTR